MMESNLESVVAVARALGHPARLRTIAMLRSGELCVCQITEVLRLAPSTVSAHLKDLKQAGLTNERKAGKWVHIALTDTPTIRIWIEEFLAPLADDPQLDEDARFVEKIRKLPVANLCRFGYEEARRLADNAN